MGRAGPGYISIPIQREAIERWANYKDVRIGEWHVDEDETGGSHDRPGLDLAIGRALDGHTTGIVSWKIDRFSRLTEHGLRDLRRLQEAGDLTARRVLGARYHEHLQARADAVDDAQAAYRQAASETQANLVLEAPDVLDDPELLPIVLRNLFPSITVVRGRGLAVADRVRFVPVDPDL